MGACNVDRYLPFRQIQLSGLEVVLSQTKWLWAIPASRYSIVDALFTFSDISASVVLEGSNAEFALQ